MIYFQTPSVVVIVRLETKVSLEEIALALWRRVVRLHSEEAVTHLRLAPGHHHLRSEEEIQIHLVATILLAIQVEALKALEIQSRLLRKGWKISCQTMDLLSLR